MKSTKILIATLFTIALFVSSCSKNQGTAQFTMKMIDAPGDYAEVNVDIQEVSIHYASSDSADTVSGWETLNANAGVYDLLKLQNGVFADLVDTTEVRSGKVTQVRLLLGPNNTIVMKDSSSYDLTVPSGLSSGIKLHGNFDLEAGGTYEMTIDFDAAKSILEQSNNRYKLKPSIKIESFIKK